MSGSQADRSKPLLRHRHILRLLVPLVILIVGTAALAIPALQARRLDRTLTSFKSYGQEQQVLGSYLHELQRELLHLEQQIQRLEREAGRSPRRLAGGYEDISRTLRTASEEAEALDGLVLVSSRSRDLLRQLAKRLSESEGPASDLQRQPSAQQRRALLAQLQDRISASQASIGLLLQEQQHTTRQALEQVYVAGRTTTASLLIGAGLLLAIGGIIAVRFRATQRRARDANRRFRLAAAAVNSAIYDWDLKRNRIVWTDGMTDVFGYQPAEIQHAYEWWAKRLHPQDAQRVCDQLESSIAQGQDFAAEYRFRAKNGQYRNVLERGCVVRGGHGRAVRMVGSMQDLTAQKHAEEALSAEKERLAVTLSSIGEGVIATDNQRRIVLINKVAEQLLGWTSEEASGRPLREVYQVASNRVPGSYEETAEGAPSSAHSALGTQSVLIARDGTQRIIADSAAPILDHAKRIIGVVLVFRDITQRTLLERQLQQTQKIESIGTLAGGLAHDFNNILTGIIGYVDLALTALPGDTGRGPLAADLQEIKKQAEHAATLTRQLLAFSRRQPFEPRDTSLNQLLTGLEKFLRYVIGDQVELQLEPQAAPSTVYGDPLQVQQVLMNLCINARDAMPEGGRLAIKTHNVCFDEEYCCRHPWARPGHWVEFSVHDTGIGMEEETLQHIFEPFFTTKEPGKGTGLGLATVYGVIRQHQGLLHVWSKPGQGSVFSIYLQQTAAQPEESRQGSDAVPQGAGELILICEEEAPVRDVVTRTLGALGYRVLSATDTATALTLCRASCAEIDLVVLDALKPQPGAPELLAELRQRHPDTRVVSISGYSTPAAPQQPDLLQEYEVLQKPFSPAELARCVRKLLDSRASRLQAGS